MLLLGLVLATSAHARDAIELEAVRVAQEGAEAPSLTVVSHVSGSVRAHLTCSGQRFDLDTAVRSGQRYPLELAGLPAGVHACRGALELRADDGTAGEMPLSLEVTVHPPLELQVALEDLDLEAHTLTLRSSRPLSAASVDVTGLGGAPLGHGETTASGEPEVLLEWASTPGEVLRLDVVGTDVDGLRGLLVLSPWSYAIPHEDVVFASGHAELQADEIPKLETAWAELEQVLATYGGVVEVQLFVGGYTDTVGNEASNQALSCDRARAIAGWFQGRGFQGPVWYQGFGEDALAVPTPDETDEQANRRAVYLLAAQRPPVNPELPRASWQRLQ